VAADEDTVRDVIHLFNANAPLPAVVVANWHAPVVCIQVAWSRWPGDGVSSLTVLMEGPGAGDAGVQVEQAAGLGGGERDHRAPCLIGYDRLREVCPRRHEAGHPAGARATPLLVFAQ